MIAKASQSRKLEFLAPLGLMLPITVEDVRQAYLEKAKSAHPDAGGNVGAFTQLQRAYEHALAYARCHGLAGIRSAVESNAQQQRVVDRVRLLGGRTETEGLEWVKREVGEDFALLFETVVGIELRGPQMSDEVLAYLAKKRHVLIGLRWLDLIDSRVSYRGLKLLGSFPKLQSVRLLGTRISWWERRKLQWSFPYIRFARSA